MYIYAQRKETKLQEEVHINACFMNTFMLLRFMDHSVVGTQDFRYCVQKCPVKGHLFPKI